MFVHVFIDAQIDEDDESDEGSEESGSEEEESDEEESSGDDEDETDEDEEMGDDVNGEDASMSEKDTGIIDYLFSNEVPLEFCTKMLLMTEI